MYKVSYVIGKINKGMKLKFNITVRGEEKYIVYNSIDENKEVSYLKETKIGDYNSLQMITYPTLSIDISGVSSYEKNNPYNYVTMSQHSVFDFSMKLERMIERFKVEDLFGYRSGKLVLNPDLGEEYREIFSTPSNKYITMIHAVVPDYEEETRLHEGIKFYIGDSSYANLTYVDLCFLKKKIDGLIMQWESLASELFNTYLMTQLLKGNDLLVEKYEEKRIIVEEVEKEPEVEIGLPKLKDVDLLDI